MNPQRAVILALFFLPACSRLNVERPREFPPNSTATPDASALPDDVPMNKGAGALGFLIIKLRLAGGEEFPCVVDTGAPGSLLPKGAEPLLGKRLSTVTFPTLDSKKEQSRIYQTPALYLGGARLRMSDHIGAWDSSLGVLGMDCLRHYCIQLDFKAGKLRFLQLPFPPNAELGKPYQITCDPYVFLKHAGLFQSKGTSTLIDTGCFYDGCLSAGLFAREAKRQDAKALPLVVQGSVKGSAPGFAQFQECVWDGATYTDLVLRKGDDLIGLRFLARHLVTFNFPERAMYLKLVTTGPLKRSE